MDVEKAIGKAGQAFLNASAWEIERKNFKKRSVCITSIITTPLLSSGRTLDSRPTLT